MWLIWEEMFGPWVLMTCCNLSVADSTTNCWRLCCLLLYDRWYCSGQQCCGVITAGRLLLLGEWHWSIRKLLKQHELVAVKPRLLWWGWRRIVCMEKQRIWISSTQTGKWIYMLYMIITVMQLKSDTWYPNSLQCKRFPAVTLNALHTRELFFLGYNKQEAAADP